MDWFNRKVLTWRLSNTMDADFCVAALDEAIARHGRPDSFNTDSQKMRASSRCGLPRTLIDPPCLSLDLSTARERLAVRLCLADACDPRRA
jgi:transposase InsO family protein